LSLTKTLCDSQKFAERYVKGWTITAEALVKLLNAAPMPVAQTDFIAENDVDDMAFGVGFTALNTCKRQPRDVFPEIADVKPWVSQYYRSGGLAGKGADAQTLMGWLEQRTSPEVRSQLSI
jgi:exportin-2 (importin alpha re-exporter)